MRKTIALLVIGLIFFSCESDDIPNSKELITGLIDIDSDKINDFELKYFEFTTDDINQTGGEKFGSIIPIDKNLILYDKTSGYLFLKKGDIIKKSDTENQLWYPYKANVISKKRKYEIWDETWTIKSNSNNDYYLGIKLKNGDDERIGWIKLDFNTDTGAVYLLESYISSSNELIIKNL